MLVFSSIAHFRVPHLSRPKLVWKRPRCSPRAQDEAKKPNIFILRSNTKRTKHTVALLPTWGRLLELLCLFNTALFDLPFPAVLILKQSLTCLMSVQILYREKKLKEDEHCCIVWLWQWCCDIANTVCKRQYYPGKVSLKLLRPPGQIWKSASILCSVIKLIPNTSAYTLLSCKTKLTTELQQPPLTERWQH